MLPRLTDFEPCCFRIQSAFGRLMPTGVAGAASPDSTTTVITLPVIPATLGLLVAVENRRVVLEPLRLLAIAPMRLRGFGSRNDTTDSKMPRIPSGSS